MKKILSVVLHISGIIHHMIFIYGALMWHDISRNFCNFFKILIFWVVSGVKGQKMAQNEKKLCLLRSISQEPYIIWSSFVVCKCKMIISSGVFLKFFQNFEFSGFRRFKGQKMAKNDKKLCLSCLISQEPYIIWSSFMVLICNRIISPGFFYIYSEFLFLGSIVG